MKKNTLYNLDSISKYSIYSKLNVNYDRMLGDRSLKGFIKMNKKPKVIKKLSYLEEIHQKYPNELKEHDKKDTHEFINKLILKNLENDKNDNLNNNNSNRYYKIFKSQPNDNQKKLSIKNYLNSNKKKYEEIISLDPFKYNPNYNAIFKKVPYVKIIEPKGKRRKNLSMNQDNIKNRNKTNSTLIPLSMDNTNENVNNNDDDNKIKEKSISVSISNINRIKLPIVKNNKMYERNNNHALRFSKYGNQKSIFSDSKNENEENYEQKNNYNNNYDNNSISCDKINMKKIFTVNFDKMMSRKGNDLINNYSLKTPSFNRYYPNYDFVKNSPAKISFSYHHLDNNDLNKKKYLLRKIMASYNVDTEFHILNKEQLTHNSSSNSIENQK